MIQSVQHNPSTLRSLHSLRRAQSSMDTSIRRLSTGFRINSAKDDPAGMIAATRLSSEIVSIQSQRKVDQIDYFKALVADGSYAALGDILHNANSLVLQSQAGPSATAADSDSLQIQLDKILQAVDHFAASLTLNGSRLLDGTTTLGSPGTPPAGSDPGTPSTLLNLQRTDTRTLGAHSARPNPSDPQTTYTLADLATGGRLSLTGADPALSPTRRAELAQTVLTTAITQLATQRAEVGSFMRYTIQSFGNILDTTEENLQAALSQIQDADYAVEVSNFVRQRTLIDSNMALLAHGMHQSRNVLSLLTPLGAP